MSLKWKLTKLYNCLEASFGVDPDADGSDYKFLPTLEDVTFQPQVEIIPREAQVNKFTRQTHVMGGKKGTLSFKVYLKANGQNAAGFTSVASETDILLTSLFGQVARGVSTQIALSGSTTGTLDLVGMGFVVGAAIKVSVSGTQYTRIVTAINSLTLTLDRVLPGIPVTGADCYAGSVYRPLDNGHQSLAFCANRDGIEYTFLGCTLQAKITSINALGLATLECTVQVADWSVTTKASLPTTVPTGITAVKPPAIKGAPFAVGGTEEPVYGFEFDPGIKFEHQESTNGGGLAGGDGNIFGFEKVDGQAQGVLKSYYAAGHLTDFTAGTEKSLVVGAGTHLNGWALYIPKAQYMQPQLEEHKGTAGESIPFMATDAGSANGGYDFALTLF